MPIYQDLYILDNNNMTLNRSFIYLKTAYNSDGLINWLRQPGLLLNLPPKSTRLNLNPLIQTCGTLTVSSPGTKSIGLPADSAADGAFFFARHLDCIIVTQNSHPSPGLGTVKTIYHDPKLFSHLPGLAKNSAPRHGRQLIKPPGRYA